MPTHVVILAAGKGTRMNSDCPKVLHHIGGKPMLAHVVDTASALQSASIHVVVGHGADQVKQYFEHHAGETSPLSWVLQKEQLGTGHAVAQALPQIEIDDDTTIVVLCGDVPLLKIESLIELVDNASQDSLSLLTLETPTPTGLGRIIRDPLGKVSAIVEEKDADEAQRLLTEINSGIMALPGKRLRDWVGRLGKNNKQGEYYLTDIIAMAVSDGCDIYTKVIQDPFEVLGVNDKSQLATLERHFQKNEIAKLLKAGVTIKDPARIDIRGSVRCGKDVTLDINVILEGSVELGDGVVVGPNSIIRDSAVEANTQILANSLLDGAKVSSDCNIGPFARLRPGTILEQGAKIGNFVEIKNSVIGKGAKANHFAYIGDADVGEGSNIGAGTIFCNYDGAYKHRSVLGKNVFIGSNSTLVSPVSIADGAFVAAGSTINIDVPEDQLAIGRGKQRNISGWKRPTKKQ